MWRGWGIIEKTGYQLDIKISIVNENEKQKNHLMADVHEPKTRSYNMSQISGKDIKPEMIVSNFLHRNGVYYCLHVNDLPEKPDFTSIFMAVPNIIEKYVIHEKGFEM